MSELATLAAGDREERRAFAAHLDRAIDTKRRSGAIRCRIHGPCHISVKRRGADGAWVPDAMMGGELIEIVGAAMKDQVVVLAAFVPLSGGRKGRETMLAAKYSHISIPLAYTKEFLDDFDVAMGPVLDNLDADEIRRSAAATQLEAKKVRWKEMQNETENSDFGSW